MSELQREGTYAGRVEFEIIGPEETARRRDEIVAFGFEQLKHGLVGFSSDGEAREKLPGHQFGRPEIVALAEALLR